MTRPLDFSRLRRTSLYSRESKVSFRGFGVPPRRGMSFARFLDGLPRRCEVATGDNRLSATQVDFNVAGRAEKIEWLSLKN